MNENAKNTTQTTSVKWLSSVLVQSGLAVINAAIVIALVPYYLINIVKKFVHAANLDRLTPSHSAAVPLKRRVTQS